MTLQRRIEVLARLGEHMQGSSEEWQLAKKRATQNNPWFIPEFVEMAASNIATQFLQKNKLEQWTSAYNLPQENAEPKTVGVVMAGNIPMVGFHDMLCVFVTGHRQHIKLSSKDEVLLRHLVTVMQELEPEVAELISFAENLKGCDAYIATGSNNSGRYFDYYFGKYPHIIRRNRTSVAVLDGTETEEELSRLADDIQSYFGLGCRNVTKLYVPKGYNFSPLLKALHRYDYYNDFHKYRHNYDYQLALLMFGSKPYITNESILLLEDPALFTAISRVNYEYYIDAPPLNMLSTTNDVQCIMGHAGIPFGETQSPSLDDYADGVDTMAFLVSL